MANYLSKDKDLVNNPSARVPICLCLDLSGSMNTVEGGEYRDTGRTEMIDGKLYNIVEGGETRVGELQNGLELFFDAIKNDDMAVDAAEVSIVGFSNNAKKLLEFDSIEKQQLPTLEADGETAMGEGVKYGFGYVGGEKESLQKLWRSVFPALACNHVGRRKQWLARTTSKSYSKS